jgi:cytochrome c556
MIPGRFCENGKPVPVQEETYRKAAEGLAAAGRAAYKAAQSKSMDAIVDVSETVSNACSNCHEPYRDFDDQSRRCTPVDAK